MSRVKAVSCLLIAALCLGFGASVDPVMTIDAPTPKMWCYGGGDYFVDVQAKTFLTEPGTVSASAFWELYEGEGYIDLGGDEDQRNNSTFAHVTTGTSGSTNFDDYHLYWSTMHGAEVGAWSDFDDTFGDTGCNGGGGGGS